MNFIQRSLRVFGDDTKQALNLVGVNGIFWFAWSFGCYQAVYLQSEGFSASQMGLLNALSSAVAIASVSFWGMISDKIGSLKKVLITVLLGGAALYALVPFIPTKLSFSVFLLIGLIPLVNFFRGSMSVFVDNILVRNCNELHLNFGVIRSAGSLLFTVGGIIISSALPFVGLRSTFWLCGLFMLPVVLLALSAREPSNRRKAVKPGEKQKLNLGELFQNPKYIAFLVFSFVFYLAVNCEGNFIPYFMKSIGVDTGKYGIILSYRALFEIPFLLLMLRLRRRFPLKYLVMGGALFMGLECLGFSLFANSLPTIILFATFFGLGNGLFIGSALNYIYELAPDHLKASAQAFWASISSVAGILGNLLGGMVFDLIGAKPFYFAVFLLYLISIAIFAASFFLKRPSKREEATA